MPGLGKKEMAQRQRFAAIVWAGLLTGACSASTVQSGPPWAAGEPPVEVRAAVETVVTTDLAVDADDPALWADAQDPARAVMFGTDKSDGLYVHNLDGSVRQFLPIGPLNNVDLRTGVTIDGRELVAVAATNDGRMGINLFMFDSATLETRDWGFVDTAMGEPYGFCMGSYDSALLLIANNKLGEIKVWRLNADGATPSATLWKRFKVGSQTEGCVVNDAAGTLYVGEEDVGIWRFALSAADLSPPVEVARIDKRRITDDVEGLTILRDGAQTYLIASSQGDNTFPVFRIEPQGETYLGRFTVVAGNGIDAVSETDGVDAWSGPIGSYPEGLLAMHDDRDDSGPRQQNYKMVDWREVKRALKLP